MNKKKVYCILLLLVFSLYAGSSWGQAFEEERANAYGQATYIWHRKQAFPALYTNLNGTPNSLISERERSWTSTVTAYLGLKPWHGAEIYFAPEVIAELPLSGLHGLGGTIQNAELQKGGSTDPTIYRSRLFLKQTWDLGGTRSIIESAPLQLGGTATSRRFTLTAGNLSILDVFDRNSFAGDLRQQFINMAFLTHAAYDFAADARGYTWGMAGEYSYDNWTLRIGRFVTPRDPNQLPLDFRIIKFYGDQIELERRYSIQDQLGKMRFLFYRNRENMGKWDDAISTFRADPSRNATTCTTFNYGSANSSAPDLCWARKTNVKVGVGLNIEQRISSETGVFLRAMMSDGKTEVYSFTSADSSLSFGTIVKGTRWGRSGDSTGIAYGKNWISKQHGEYLKLGGIDGFIGDGQLNRRPEQLVELFYSYQLAKYLWMTFDLQHIANPAYNADRGPLNLIGLRLHVEM